MNFKIRYILLAAIVCLSSCIKENRGPCPTFYTLDIIFSFPTDLDCQLDVRKDGGEESFLDKFSPSSLPYVPGVGYLYKYEGRVSKGHGTVCSVMGLSDNSEYEDMQVRIREGKQCDSLWTDYHSVSFSGEFTHETISLYKQYCRLSLVLNYERSENNPIELKVTGKVNGIDVVSSKPLYGKFSALAKPAVTAKSSTIDNFYILVPRQAADDELVLVMKKGNGDEQSPIYLHELLNAADYDWSSPNLKDVSLTFSENKVSIKIEDWQFGGEYDYEI